MCFAPLPHPLVASLRFRPSAFCEIPVLPGVSRGQIMVSMKLQRNRFKNAVQDPASLVYHPQDEQNMDPLGTNQKHFWGVEVLSSVPVEKPHLGSTSVRIWVPQNMDSQHSLIAKKYQQTQKTHPRKDRKGLIQTKSS